MTASRSTSERLRVGIVGGGAIAQVAHLPTLKKVKSVEVVAICDTDLPKARALADRFGVPDALDDIEDLLRTPGIQAAVICSPNHMIKAVPAVKVIMVIKRKAHPGSMTTNSPPGPVICSSPTLMPNPWIRLKRTVPYRVYWVIFFRPASPSLESLSK